MPTEKDGIGQNCIGVVDLHARSEPLARSAVAGLKIRAQEWNERRIFWAIERVSRHVLRSDAKALHGAEQCGRGMAAVLEYPAVTPGGNE